MKKIFLISSCLFLLFALSACGKKPIMMDQINQQGFYPYSNDTLGFNLSLPKEFQYFQTERTSNDNSTDLHVFVPTADITAPKTVPGYAEPVIVKVFQKSSFDALSESAKKALNVVGEKNGRVYALQFWKNIPSDWNNKWSDAMKKQLIDNFKLK